MKTVGILGGGQLARMMILAGAPLGLRFRIYDPSPEACAGQLAPLVTGQFDDLAALQIGLAGIEHDLKLETAQRVAGEVDQN